MLIAIAGYAKNELRLVRTWMDVLVVIGKIPLLILTTPLLPNGRGCKGKPIAWGRVS